MDYLTVILAEELTPYFVDNNIHALVNNSEVVWATTTPYLENFDINQGDFLSAICDAGISPTGGSNPVKVLQVLERIVSGVTGPGKLIWIYQDSSPGVSFSYPGNYAALNTSYIMFASSTSEGVGGYFLNVFNNNNLSHNYTIEAVQNTDYINFSCDLPPGSNLAYALPNAGIITATTIDVYVTTPDPSAERMYLTLSYQSDGYLEPTVTEVYDTGWYSIPVYRNIDLSLEGFNIELFFGG